MISKTFAGGGHCDAARFRIETGLPASVQPGNSSMCVKTGFLPWIVPAARFRLLKGQRDLSCYTFNTGVAQHLLCRHRGIKFFYVPRSNPDGFSVKVRRLDEVTP